MLTYKPSTPSSASIRGTLVPLRIYGMRATDLMLAKMKGNATLPPSQVVRAVAGTAPNVAPGMIKMPD